MKYALIAGNGRFPILALETARQTGRENIFLCPAGLISCVLPIVQNKTFAGGLFMGKVRIRSGPEEEADFPENVRKKIPR